MLTEDQEARLALLDHLLTQLEIELALMRSEKIRSGVEERKP